MFRHRDIVAHEGSARLGSVRVRVRVGSGREPIPWCGSWLRRKPCLGGGGGIRKRAGTDQRSFQGCERTRKRGWTLEQAVTMAIQELPLSGNHRCGPGGGGCFWVQSPGFCSF